MIAVVRLILLVLFFLSVTAQNKVTYTYAIKENDTLKLDVYTPNQISESQRLPVLLWMHGGGFSVGSRDYKDESKPFVLLTKLTLMPTTAERYHSLPKDQNQHGSQN